MAGDRAAGSQRPLAVYADAAGIELHGAPAMLRQAGFELQVARASTAAEVVEVGRGATALLVGSVPIGAPVFAVLTPALRIVSSASAGVDHIDLEAARAAGVWVSNVPDAATEEVAVHALAMALALMRNLPPLDRHVRDGGWQWDAAGVPRRPSTLTLGIVGVGRIGRTLAELAEPIFGRVLGTDPLLAEAAWPAEVERVELDALVTSADVISLHAPLGAGNRPMLDAATLGRCKPGAYLVNVARGGIVDEPALITALDEGRLGGAALDVRSHEPPRAPDSLAAHPRVLSTPHVAYLSQEAERAYLEKQAENVIAWYRTGRPRDPVVEPITG